jgi:hypothetical protein
MMKKRKIGAPPKRNPRPGERFTIATRVQRELKLRLDAAAEASGRSQAQETELRLERSFDRTDLLSEVLSLAFGKELAGLLIILGTAMHDQGRRITGKSDWATDPVAYDAAVVAALWLLDLGQPEGSRASAADRDIAAQWGEDLIQAINAGGAEAKAVLGSDPRGELTRPIAKRMSEALARRRGQLKGQDVHNRSSSRKAREAS